MRKIIGLRTIKTAVAILLCLVFYLLLKSFEYIPGCPKNFAYTWYNPFFAGIATAYSVHASKESSLTQAKNRCVASIIGGCIGISLITFYELCGGVWPNLSTISFESLNFILPYLLISMFSMVVVVVGVALKQQQAVFVSILTFLSVTVNPNVNVSNWEWQFGVNRILSTMIGVLIALGVNLFHLPHLSRNKDLLFCVGIEGIIHKDSDRIRGFMRYKMNHLASLGVNVTMFTTRTPTTFMPLLIDVKVNHPVICMSGAALYDTQKLKYLATEPIPREKAKQIAEILKSNHITPFVNMIEEDVLFTYCEHIDNLGEKIYADSKKNASYCNYIHAVAPDKDVLYFLVVEHKDKSDEVIQAIQNSSVGADVTIQVYDNFETGDVLTGLQYIKIYSKKIEQLNVLHQYCLEHELKTVGLTTSALANHLLANSDISVTISSAEESVKKTCTHVLRTDSYDALFKAVHRIYHSNLSKRSKA